MVNILRSDIAEIIFLRREHKASRANLPEGSDKGWLLRPGVDPVPCKLDGVGGAKVAVSTKIGQFHLPLDTLGRYVMTHWNKAPNTDVVGWEIGLTDGSVFHGKLSGGEGKSPCKSQINLLLQFRLMRSVTSGTGGGRLVAALEIW